MYLRSTLTFLKSSTSLPGPCILLSFPSSFAGLLFFSSCKMYLKGQRNVSELSTCFSWKGPSSVPSTRQLTTAYNWLQGVWHPLLGCCIYRHMPHIDQASSTSHPPNQANQRLDWLRAKLTSFASGVDRSGGHSCCRDRYCQGSNIKPLTHCVLEATGQENSDPSCGGLPRGGKSGCQQRPAQELFTHTPPGTGLCLHLHIKGTVLAQNDPLITSFGWLIGWPY